MTVQDLIDALQSVPNPSVTDVAVTGVAGATVTVDDSAVVSGGIDLADGGTLNINGA
jgi:hypothetical protein